MTAPPPTTGGPAPSEATGPPVTRVCRTYRLISSSRRDQVAAAEHGGCVHWRYRAGHRPEPVETPLHSGLAGIGMPQVQTPYWASRGVSRAAVLAGRRVERYFPNSSVACRACQDRRLCAGPTLFIDQPAPWRPRKCSVRNKLLVTCMTSTHLLTSVV
jgi:hypothetical protein